MDLTPEFSRLAKMLIDAEGITQAAAEVRLRALTLEIVAGRGIGSVAAQNALLTAVAVGVRTFVGGVSVRFLEDAPLVTALPVVASTLREAVAALGATPLLALPKASLAIGAVDSGTFDAHVWWDGWTGGTLAAAEPCGVDDNPLAGVAAGAAGVARAFAAARGTEYPDTVVFDLWPGCTGPEFGEVFLPGAIWLLGLGNLGQALTWSLTALPYSNPGAVELVMQDRDKVGAENWGTSILVRSGVYGGLKSAAAENWAKAKGFAVRRVDRWLDDRQRVDHDDPVLAFCAFDKIAPRKAVDACGFEAVIDVGLGRRHSDFDRYRITVFDPAYSLTEHFAGSSDARAPAAHDYEKLLGLDACGAAVFEGIAVAAPFVSAIAGAAAVARGIALASGSLVPRNETRRLTDPASRLAPGVRIAPRGLIRQRPSALTGRRETDLG